MSYNHPRHFVHKPTQPLPDLEFRYRKALPRGCNSFQPPPKRVPTAWRAEGGEPSQFDHPQQPLDQPYKCSFSTIPRTAKTAHDKEIHAKLDHILAVFDKWENKWDATYRRIGRSYAPPRPEPAPNWGEHRSTGQPWRDPSPLLLAEGQTPPRHPNARYRGRFHDQPHPRTLANNWDQGGWDDRIDHRQQQGFEEYPRQHQRLHNGRPKQPTYRSPQPEPDLDQPHVSAPLRKMAYPPSRNNEASCWPSRLVPNESTAPPRHCTISDQTSARQPSCCDLSFYPFRKIMAETEVSNVASKMTVIEEICGLDMSSNQDLLKPDNNGHNHHNQANDLDHSCIFVTGADGLPDDTLDDKGVAIEGSSVPPPPEDAQYKKVGEFCEEAPHLIEGESGEVKPSNGHSHLVNCITCNHESSHENGHGVQVSVTDSGELNANKIESSLEAEVELVDTDGISESVAKVEGFHVSAADPQEVHTWEPGRVAKLSILALSLGDLISLPSLFFYGGEEGTRATARCVFDPGGDASPRLLLSTLVVASWIPP